MIYNLDTKLKFGKYKNKTIEEIYLGRSVLYKEEEINLLKTLNIKLDSYEAKNNIKLKLNQQVILGSDLENIGSLKVANKIWDLKKEIPNIERDMYNEHFRDVVLFDRLLGQTSYISWCINTIDKFCILPGHLNKLEKLNYIHEIKVIADRNSIKEISFKYKKSTFSHELKTKNLKKYCKIEKIDYSELINSVVMIKNS